MLCPFENEDLINLNKSDIIGKKILVCEDTTITGNSFIKVYTQLKNIGAEDVKFFSFLMRRGSSIVPNLFVFETEKDTKVYFPWSSYPIRIYSKGIVRKITPSDIEKDFECGDPRIDKTLLTDFYKDHMHAGAKVYLVEDKDEICSIIKFYEKTHGDYTGLFLDIIATAKEKHGNKYANTLLKLILNYIFYHEFDFIYGYAFDAIVKLYKNIGFEVIGSVQDNHYDTLHKVATVNKRTKAEKDLVIATLKSNI
ncbi:MAG: hypothetical protein LAKADJCE_00846 [Candidatus Argoarchaeum ethanivorans]|uniref:N-acetyltransferase domain-containing protein n=1 Tax=Candidatus Argoarchaeum ethanivorans TaxID=2608793 RepID=A0A811TAS9_9EURY|nr:MAG: hypothetical protein LAKADJCE_00846 [Candidatus Argoarchaeum ethanivorans]